MSILRPRTLEDLFSKIKSLITKTKSGCLEYGGSLDKEGYGRISFKSKKYLVHRLIWEYNFPNTINNFYVCHKCDNPKCANIEHLFLGTSLDNNMDKINKGRDINKSKTKCKYGHNFSSENTYLHKNKRRCKTCHRNNMRKYSLRYQAEIGLALIAKAEEVLGAE